jgi:hypothetical protein
MREEAARSRLESADPLNPIANVRAGVRYLQRMVTAFHDVELALMAYNAGPSRIRRHLREGGVPERFLAYPRSVTRERERLAAADESDAAPASLCVAHARSAPDRAATGSSASALAASHGGVAPPALDAAPTLVAIAPTLRRARSPGAGSTAPPPRSRS